MQPKTPCTILKWNLFKLKFEEKQILVSVNVHLPIILNPGKFSGQEVFCRLRLNACTSPVSSTSGSVDS